MVAFLGADEADGTDGAEAEGLIFLVSFLGSSSSSIFKLSSILSANTSTDFVSTLMIGDSAGSGDFLPSAVNSEGKTSASFDADAEVEILVWISASQSLKINRIRIRDLN